MIEYIRTTNNKSFVFDEDMSEENNGILRGPFIILFANKVIRKSKDKNESYGYEYPSYMFDGMNICKLENIKERRNANDLEMSIYTALKSKNKLTDEMRSNLRQNYLNTIFVNTDDK